MKVRELYVRGASTLKGTSTLQGALVTTGAVTLYSTLDVTGKAVFSDSIKVSDAYITSTGGKVSIGSSDGGRDGVLQGAKADILATGANNSIDTCLVLDKQVTGGAAGANGIGVAAQVDLANSAATLISGASLQFYMSDVTAGSEDCTFKLRLIKAGTLTDAVTVTSLGDMTIAGDLTVNGTTTTLYTANVLVEDKLITLNDGGAGGSGSGVGIEVEENAVVTGYIKTNTGRTGWDVVAPTSTEKIELLPGGASVFPASGSVAGMFKMQLSCINPTINTDHLYEDSGNAIGTWAASGANFLVTSSATYKKGSGVANSLKFACNGTASDGDYCADTRASVNWGTANRIGFWIYSPEGISAGDVNLYGYDGAGGTTTNETDIGAVVANTWTYKVITIAWTQGDIDRLGFMLTAQGAAKTFTFYVNHITRFVAAQTTALAQVPQFEGIHGIFSEPEAAASDHTATALVENTGFAINYSGTGNAYIPLTDQSALTVRFLYCYV